MSRKKRLSTANAKPSTSISSLGIQKEEDLAYYVHDRVELMRQVFCILSPKEIKALAPECLRKLSNDEIEELCLDELLGISSKRVCAIIDGAEPPSETSSSDSEDSKKKDKDKSADVVDLDSSSDVSRHTERKSRKKRRKKRRRRSDSSSVSDESHESREETAAGDAGLAGSDHVGERRSTVLELLELQARARAMKAQLRLHTAAAAAAVDQVEVKTETPIILEISSDDEKPTLEQLASEADKQPPVPPPPPPPPPQSNKKKKKKKQKHKEDRSPKRANTDNCTRITQTDKDSSVPANSETQHINDAPNVTTNRNGDEVCKDDKVKKLDDHDDVVVIDDDEETVLDSHTPKVNAEDENAAAIDFTVTVPQVVPTSRKIHLDKNNVVISVPNVPTADVRVASVVKQLKRINSTVKKVRKLSSAVIAKRDVKAKTKARKRKVEKEIDHDEIELQLSESEKVDLLEDLERDRGNIASDSGDSSDDAVADDVDKGFGDKANKTNEVEELIATDAVSVKPSEDDKNDSDENNKETCRNNDTLDVNIDRTETIINNNELVREDDVCNINKSYNSSENILVDFSAKKHAPLTIESLRADYADVNKSNICISVQPTIQVSCIDDIPLIHEEFGPKTEENSKNVPIEVEEDRTNGNDAERNITNNVEANLDPETSDSDKDSSDSSGESDSDRTEAKEISENENNLISNNEDVVEFKEIEDVNERVVVDDKTSEIVATEKGLSKDETQSSQVLEEGELTDKSDSEVEAFDVQPEIVCISDDDATKMKTTKMKKSKKHKKEKKAKKNKKADDENFFRQENVSDQLPNIMNDDKTVDTTKEPVEIIVNVDDKERNSGNDSDVYEILDLSDDSSCYEVEGVSVLSKEPTSEEIEALSAKIDEFQRVDVVDVGEQIERKEKTDSEMDILDAENISWKDRYLDSKKVKKVLTTSNILNAIRKKNKELKRKMMISKNVDAVTKENDNTEAQKDTENIEEGTIEYFNKLEGSTKYVDPVPEQTIDKEQQNEKTEEEIHINLTNEMKKDAKQLLKMYKRLLKYNDMNKQKEKDPNRKKKAKKAKKKKDGGKNVSKVANVQNS